MHIFHSNNGCHTVIRSPVLVPHITECLDTLTDVFHFPTPKSLVNTIILSITMNSKGLSYTRHHILFVVLSCLFHWTWCSTGYQRCCIRTTSLLRLNSFQCTCRCVSLCVCVCGGHISFIFFSIHLRVPCLGYCKLCCNKLWASIITSRKSIYFSRTGRIKII